MNPRLTLIASCMAAALASAGVVQLLDVLGVINPAAIAKVESAAEVLAASGTESATEAALIPLQPSLIETGSIHDRDAALDREPAPARLAFVARKALPLRLQSLIDEPAGRDPKSWTTESHVTTPTPPPADRVAIAHPEAQPWQDPSPVTAARPVTLAERLAEISPGATKRLAEKFSAANAAWPPAAVSLIALKDKKTLELHARSNNGAWVFIHRYPVLAASGKSGPKLSKGDKQVPEGVYGISFLNPNSKYHVALRVNYPNAFDREMAAKDGRKHLGGDIMIHGKALSIGCLAVGDEASEELFVLAAEVGLPNVKLVIAPADFRHDGVPTAKPGQPAWLPKLYIEVASAMAEFKAPAVSSGLLSFFGQ